MLSIVRHSVDAIFLFQQYAVHQRTERGRCSRPAVQLLQCKTSFSSTAMAPAVHRKLKCRSRSKPKIFGGLAPPLFFSSPSLSFLFPSPPSSHSPLPLSPSEVGPLKYS